MYLLRFLNALVARLNLWTRLVLVLIAGTFGWSRLFGRIPDKTSIMAIALGGMFVVCFDLLLLNHRGDDSRWWFVALLPILAVAVAIESGFTPAARSALTAAGARHSTNTTSWPPSAATKAFRSRR